MEMLTILNLGHILEFVHFFQVIKGQYGREIFTVNVLVSIEK